MVSTVVDTPALVVSTVLDMTLSDEQVQELERLDLTVREAKVLYDNARAVREQAIRRIAAEGGTYREIGARAGVAYQRVAQIVTGRQPPAMNPYDTMDVPCRRCGAGGSEPCDGRPVGFHAERHADRLRAFEEAHPELG